MNKLLQVGVADQLGITNLVREQMDEQALMRRAREQGKDPFQLAKEEREALEAQLKGQKNLTKDFVDSQTALADFGRNVQRLGFDFLPKAASAVQSFTTTLNDAVKSIRKGLGMAEAAPATGGAPGGTRMGAAAARKRGAAPSAPAPGGGVTPELSIGGLRLKSAEATAGGQSDQRLIGLAHQIQQQLGGELVYFSALNDTYERGGNSKHGQGLALDFTIKNPKYSTGTADLVRNILAQAGLKGRVIDEYLNPSKSATGGHIHVELEAMAKGGITKGPSIAGEAGPEAVVPLPDGKSIPITFAGMNSEGAYNMGSVSTDTKLTDMIMQRLGLTDMASKKMINMSGLGMNYNLGGTEFGSKIGGGVLQSDIADQVGKLVEGGQPLNEALKSTLNELNSALQEFVKQQSSASDDGMLALMSQLIDLQRNQNRTSEKILQVSQN